ncbi:MAG: YCF48-related protein, partial [candidate division KSB1 bacterium]|nr:YCF48-related protein [candidate division KSB1 bacterium]
MKQKILDSHIFLVTDEAMHSKRLLLSPIVCIIGLLLCPQHPVHAQGWQWQNPLPQGNRLGEIQFVDSLHGWIRAEGRTILRTTDGGHTWSEEVIGNGQQEVYFQRIYFVDQLHGWAVGSGAPPVIMRTRDGGKTWESLPIPAERNT